MATQNQIEKKKLANWCVLVSKFGQQARGLTPCQEIHLLAKDEEMKLKTQWIKLIS